MRKINIAILLMALISYKSYSQSITKATIGSIGGQFRNGNVILNYTLGEAFVGTQTNGNVQLGTGFWSVVPAGYTSSAVSIYRFVGNGNFSVPANWESGVVPPDPLPSNAEVIIAPAGAGQCVLNIPFHVSPGGKFSVVAGKKFIVPGVLNLQ